MATERIPAATIVRQDRLDVGCLRGCPQGRQTPIAHPGSGGTDQARGHGQCGECGGKHVGDGGLAVGASDRERAQSPGRMTVDHGTDRTEDRARVRAHHGRDIPGARQFDTHGIGEDRRRPGAYRICGESGPVRPGTGKGRVQVAGRNGMGVQRDAGHAAGLRLHTDEPTDIRQRHRRHRLPDELPGAGCHESITARGRWRRSASWGTSSRWAARSWTAGRAPSPRGRWDHRSDRRSATVWGSAR